MQAWVHVRNDGGGTPLITRAFPETIGVRQEQPGVYVVELPLYFQSVVAVGSLASSAGMITVTPGDEAGLAGNEIRVVTLNPQGNFAEAVDFSLWAAIAPPMIEFEEDSPAA